MALTDEVVQLLEFIFNDSKNHLISYWIWECNFGEDFNIGDIEYEDGVTPDLSTDELLYDYLVECMEE